LSFGASSTAGGSNSTAYGFNSTASGSSAVAIGDSSVASADGAVAMGLNSSATGPNAIAIGQGATATGSVAMGTSSSAANGGAAYGDFSSATGTDSTAIGPNATATHANSAAFGNGARTTRANQQVFGTASNSYTMPGLTSSHSKSSQGAPTHLVTSNAKGDLAAYTFAELGLASHAEMDALNARMNEVSAMNDRALAGVAMAFAMAGSPTLLDGERFAMSGNWGTFEGQNGLAMNGAVRLAKSVQLNGGVAYGVNEDLAGGRVGVRVGW
jgi:autotransporter adhesin